MKFDCQCPTKTSTVVTSSSLSSILFVLFSLIIAVTEGRADRIDECCRSHNIPDICVQTLCYPLRTPGDFDVYDIFNPKNNCSAYLPKIAICLADGRDHLRCCRSEAKDTDRNACFGLCKGVGKNKDTWINYQSCLTVNLPSIFFCLQKGYINSPTPPQKLRLEQIEINSVTIIWEEPQLNSNQVENYRVVVTEQVDSAKTATPYYSEDEYEEEIGEEEDEESVGGAPKRMEIEVGRETSLKVENLQPGTLYNAFVIAIGKSPTHRSLSSDMLDFQTIGISPEIFAYKEAVRAPIGAKSAVIACKFHMSSVSYKTAKILWQYRATENNNFKILTASEHYNMSHYIWSSERPREYIMTLEINRVISSDFGFYRCSVSDSYGNSNANIQLNVATLGSSSAAPPESPLECCEARGVEKRCMSMCGAPEGGELKRTMPLPYMPLNCSIQISKVLSCAMSGIDDSECCLLKNVPRSCIYLCDGSVAPENRMGPSCRQFALAVESCRMAGVEQRPSSILGLRAQLNPATNTIAVQWEQSLNTDSVWKQKSSLNTNRKIQGGAEDIVLVAENVYGISQAARLRYNNSKWILF